MNSEDTSQRESTSSGIASELLPTKSVAVVQEARQTSSNMANKVNQLETLVYVGFVVVVLMAGTMIIAVFTVFISLVLFFGNENKLNLEKLYQFETANKITCEKLK